MKIKFITIGDPKGEYLSIFLEFQKRIGRFAQLEVMHVKENKSSEQKILSACKGFFTILFDEHGKELTSKEFAIFLEKKKLGGESSIAFVIGGTDGHTEAVRSVSNYSLALSKLTLPHDLAMVVAIEALYRVLTISAGHPYHRE